MTLLSTVLAQTEVKVTPNTGVTGGVLETVTIGNIVSWLVNIVLVIAGLIFFLMLIVGGLRWILSGGDKANTEAARNQITAALVGLIIVFSAWAIALLLKEVFGIDILNFTIPSITG